MPFLTPDILANFPFQRYTDYKTIQRGQDYFRGGHVTDIQFEDDLAICEVVGNYDTYEVEIHHKRQGQLLFSCTCPQAEMTQICKHMVAATLAVCQYLKTGEIQEDWQYRIRQALEQSPRRQGGGNVQKYAAFFLLYRADYFGRSSFYLLPGLVKTSEWDILHTLRGAEPAQLNDLLQQNRQWQSHFETPSQAVNPNGCLNLPVEGRAFFNFVIQQRRYYGEFSGFAAYLPMLIKMEIPIFLSNERRKIGERLTILADPVEVQATLARDGEKVTLEAGLQLGDRVYSSAKSNLQVVTDDPPWVLLGNILAPVRNPESLPLLAALPVEIPAGDEETFRRKYFHQIAARVPLRGEMVNWEDVAADAVPRLYLQTDRETLRAEMRFGYGDHELNADPHPAPVTTMDLPGSWTLLRIHRQPEREAQYYDLLTESRFGLKRAGREFPYGTFEIRARLHPYDFLMHSIPSLTEAGFEVFGDTSALGKVNRNTPTLRLNLTSGLDWFELNAIVQYGDQGISLTEIRKALKKGDRYIKLADGSIGQIPETWLERYKHLFGLGQETESGLRLSSLQLSLVDDLLADAEQKNITPEFYLQRERLKTLDGIQPKPVPAGFTGELRPYQRAGLDWLHFLHTYGFGGILADDMGLGKTVQVLAFVQSLKEEEKAGSDGFTIQATAGARTTSLLVVPKSLLANWQRESARFTPGLRILEYFGNARDKQTVNFDGYDIILTTYGTMLRDIEHLRTYRFHYAILDEAQAIKNPLAQSAKAARLLNADHRLAMTGTPVENNTFELWSQFAFVNPGLLGSMEYFKREFATPIESRQSEETAVMLKQMIHPLLLRRTKEQVAPELPPRTERIVYTDLEPAQRKLYQQTRDYYRGLLLGMIEEGGMENTRMKILEGLLRLRQLCIHPALVEPAFRGDSAKFEVLLETLDTLQAEGHKALVFSQFVQTLQLLAAEMQMRGLSYTYLDGKTRDRQERVDQFQGDPSISFFLISLKAGGVGLNLTAADYVLHIDPWWNPAVEMQASDRAHRIGQDKPVFIYKFIARDTVEEKILELQGRKKKLVEQLIAAEGSFFKSITKEDVQALFS